MESPYPFKFVNMFFTSINFKRPPVLAESLQIPITFQTKLVDDKNNPNRLQFNLLISTGNNAPIDISLELVALFDYIGPDGYYDNNLKFDFYKNRGLYFLLPNMAQMVRIISSEMGMNPLDITIPVNVDLTQMESEYISQKDNST